MKFSLSPEQDRVHKRALKVSRLHARLEWQLIRSLQEVESRRVHKSLGFSSVFKYAVEALRLSESVALAFIAVARKAKDVVPLAEAIRRQALSVSKASRMVSCVNAENASELIAFAKSHTSRELDFEVASRNPKAKGNERAKPVSGDLVEIKVTISKAAYEKLMRAQSLGAHKGEDEGGMAQVLEAALDAFLDRHCPLKKALRAQARRRAKEARGGLEQADDKSLCTDRVPGPESQAATPRRRIRLKAAEKHEVFARAGGRCMFTDEHGRRCANERWLHIHHLRPVSLGGGNGPENTTLLCSDHHSLVHQLSFPIDGQITWLRSPGREYVA